MTKIQFDELINAIRNLTDIISNCSTTHIDNQKRVFACSKNRARYRPSNKRNIRPSVVVPNETYTIRELFERAVISSMPDGLARPYYAEDTDDASILLDREVVDFSRLDLVELDDYRSRLNDKIGIYKTELEAVQAKIRDLQAKDNKGNGANAQE